MEMEMEMEMTKYIVKRITLSTGIEPATFRLTAGRSNQLS
jgi:hypothetical protein